MIDINSNNYGHIKFEDGKIITDNENLKESLIKEDKNNIQNKDGKDKK